MHTTHTLKPGFVVRRHQHEDVKEIVVEIGEEDKGGTLWLYMPYDLALELASKIESTYQGIVGPVPPEPAIQKNGPDQADDRGERADQDEFEEAKPAMQRFRRPPA